MITIKLWQLFVLLYIFTNVISTLIYLSIKEIIRMQKEKKRKAYRHLEREIAENLEYLKGKPEFDDFGDK